MWDSTPWFVGGGATHSPEVARLLAYAATSGAEGIVAAGDLKVVPLATPGASVRVLSGACLILNRASGGSQQTYVGRNPSEDVKGVAATGSGGGRNDLVIAHIKDPFLPGEPWADPTDVTAGPYIFTTIVPNVPLGATVSNEAASAHLRTLGYSGIPLAALVLPSNTTTMTTGVIKDLRKLARPRRDQTILVPNVTTVVPTAGTLNAWSNWPLPPGAVEVPTWATHASVVTVMSGVQASPQDHYFLIRNVLAVAGFAALYSPEAVVDLDNGGVAGLAHTRETFVLASNGSVAHLQGQTVGISVETYRAAGELIALSGTHIVHTVTFTEKAV